uniref:Uncharacterized protein n=1 Tax=Oryza brachyantha TaxID=4533 RepID=J3M120_ORYBR
MQWHKKPKRKRKKRAQQTNESISANARANREEPRYPAAPLARSPPARRRRHVRDAIDIMLTNWHERAAQTVLIFTYTALFIRPDWILASTALQLA